MPDIPFYNSVKNAQLSTLPTNGRLYKPGTYVGEMPSHKNYTPAQNTHISLFKAFFLIVPRTRGFPLASQLIVVNFVKRDYISLFTRIQNKRKRQQTRCCKTIECSFTQSLMSCNGMPHCWHKKEKTALKNGNVNFLRGEVFVGIQVIWGVAYVRYKKYGKETRWKIQERVLPCLCVKDG